MKIEKRTIIEAIAAVLTAVATALTTLFLSSCGTTKVAVSKPEQGTSTTITVTTNNPVTTNLEPNTTLNYGNK